jgi:hypothetical protein
MRSHQRSLAGLSLLLVCSGPAHADGHEFTYGGRLKVDAIYSDRSVGGANLAKADLAFVPSSIPVARGSGSWHLNGRESRLWGLLRMRLAERPLALYAEVDWFDTRRDERGTMQLSPAPRLRHAYASYGDLTLGKTYTTFTNLAAYPEINDANGPLGVTNIRQFVARISRDTRWGTWQLALEEPASTLTDDSGHRLHIRNDSFPDMIGRAELRGTWGNVSLAGMIRRVQSQRDDEWGGAVGVSGRLLVSAGDNVRFSIAAGNALGRYLSFNALDDAMLDARGKLDLTLMAGGYLAYQHWWSPAVRSNWVLGVAATDRSAAAASRGISETLASSHLNLLWSPSLKLTCGLEWLHGYRRLEDGRSGTLNRLQFSIVYNF